MTRPITVETAPDRRTAEALLLAALREGVRGEDLRASWGAWVRRQGGQR